MIFVTEDDREGCLINALGAYVPHMTKSMDEYMLGVARARKAGSFSAI